MRRHTSSCLCGCQEGWCQEPSILVPCFSSHSLEHPFVMRLPHHGGGRGSTVSFLHGGCGDAASIRDEHACYTDVTCQAPWSLVLLLLLLLLLLYKYIYIYLPSSFKGKHGENPYDGNMVTSHRCGRPWKEGRRGKTWHIEGRPRRAHIGLAAGRWFRSYSSSTTYNNQHS